MEFFIRKRGVIYKRKYIVDVIRVGLPQEVIV